MLSRLGEDLATFTPRGFFRNDIEVEVLDGAHVPAGLIVFGIWMLILYQRDSAAASG